MKSVVAALVLACHVAITGMAVCEAADDVAEDLTARVQAFAQQLRCLVCQNETLADSQAELAVDLRHEIREQMAAGKSDRQIKAFLTERYGDFVLYRPPWKPSTYLLWLGPFVFLGGGIIALYRSLGRWPALSEIRPLTPGEQKRARRLLESTHTERSR